MLLLTTTGRQVQFWKLKNKQTILMSNKFLIFVVDMGISKSLSWLNLPYDWKMQECPRVEYLTDISGRPRVLQNQASNQLKASNRNQKKSFCSLDYRYTSNNSSSTPWRLISHLAWAFLPLFIRSFYAYFEEVNHHYRYTYEPSYIVPDVCAFFLLFTFPF